MNPFYKELIWSTFLLGIAFFIGGVLPLLGKPSQRRMPLVLALAAGFLLGSAFFHMAPEAFELSGRQAGLWIVGGFMMLLIMERFITVHLCEILDCEVHHLSVSAFAGIGLHTLTNGIALGSGLLTPHLGPSVLLAVLAHKGPEIFSLSTVLRSRGTSRGKIFLAQALLLSLIPLGALIAYYGIGSHNQNWLGAALGLSAGTFLHIALSDILPEVHRHTSSRSLSILSLLTGLVAIWFLQNAFIGHGS